MADADSEREKGHPIFSYSLTLRILADVALMALIIILNIYDDGPWDYPRTIGVVLLLGLGTYDIQGLWRKPLRKVSFFDNHIEISGWSVNITADYEDIEYLERKRRIIGDFRSGSALWLSVKGDPNDFMVPNRKVGNPKMELYSWLLQKNPKAGRKEPRP